MTLDTPKGVRDFLPEDKIRRQKIVAVLQQTFEKYGFNPIETPALELYKTLASKYAGGDEILKETYSLIDNGQRKLGLRYDLTVPFSRIIAMNAQLKFPFKRYQIDRVWRDGPLKLGRYREFWQCDVDVAGAKSLLADAELLALAADVFQQLQLEVIIEVNNRKLLDTILAFANISEEKRTKAILCIDKLKKIGVEGVKKELTSIDVTKDSIEKLSKILEKPTIENVKAVLGENEGLSELLQVVEYCKTLNVKVTPDISLARGLSYYTGTIFEVFLKNSQISSAVAAGGRYDNIIGQLTGKEQVPAVGISFGLDVLSDAIKLDKKDTQQRSVVQVFVIPIKAEKEAVELVSKLRKAGIPTDVDLVSKGISKNLSFADSYGIPYVIIIGENEVKEQKYTLRNMTDGSQKKVSFEEIVKSQSKKNRPV